MHQHGHIAHKIGVHVGDREIIDRRDPPGSFETDDLRTQPIGRVETVADVKVLCLNPASSMDPIGVIIGHIMDVVRAFSRAHCQCPDRLHTGHEGIDNRSPIGIAGFRITSEHLIADLKVLDIHLAFIGEDIRARFKAGTPSGKCTTCPTNSTRRIRPW